MNPQPQVSIKHDKLLGIANNTLYQCFFKTNRNKAKHLFNDIDKGKSVSLIVLETNKGGEIECFLALDKSEFVGRLNFSLFRTALGSLIKSVVAVQESGDAPNVLTNEQTGDIIFNIPGLCEHSGQVNVLMLGTEQRGAGALQFKLQFLDPSQFVRKNDAAAETDNSAG